jgi:hypothetical protein
VTFPVWALPVLLWKKKWLAFERRRVIAAQRKAVLHAADVPWKTIGVLVVGGSSWLATGVLPQVAFRELGQEVDWAAIVISLTISLACGFGFGCYMKNYMTRKPR